MEKKSVSTSKVQIAQIMMPNNSNPSGNIFGGVIMSIIDNAAAIAALRHTHHNCVTASVDRIDFLSPVYVGNLVIAKASVNYVSHTSMEIGVKVEAECLLKGTKSHIASAYLTFVALDENDKPTSAPELILESEEEKRRFEEGKIRRESRIKKRKRVSPNAPCIDRSNRRGLSF